MTSLSKGIDADSASMMTITEDANENERNANVARNTRK
jgi:hypothetical protein